MKGYAPVVGLPAHQQEPVAEVFNRFVAAGFDRTAVGAGIDEHVATLELACRDEDDCWTLAGELEQMVRWLRAPAYCLAYVFQRLTQRRGRRVHVAAALLFADAQIGLAEDRSLSSIEVAWAALQRIIEQAPDIEPALARARADIERRLRLHHTFYATWTRPFDYMSCDQLTEHLYGQRVYDSIRHAYPAEGRQPRGEALWRIAAQAQDRDDAYHWLTARRFAQFDAGDDERAAAELAECERDARELGLEAEVGHILRQRASALVRLGAPREAAAELERALAHEQPIGMFRYWYALTARELGDVRTRKAPEHPSGAAAALDGALQAYGAGRRQLDVVLAGGGPSAGTAIKRQMLRSYTDNALEVALACGREADALAEVEASGPRALAETLAEIRAAAALPHADAERFLEAREVFHRHLTSVPSSFEQYLDELPAQYADRYAYEVARSGLRVLGGRHSDDIAERLLAHRGDDRLVLAFQLGPSRSGWALLLDLADGSLQRAMLGATETPLRSAHADHARALAAAALLPDPAPAMRKALDALLAATGAALAPALELLAARGAGRRLIVVPQMQLNAVPLHALPVAGEPLIDLVRDVAFVPSLGLLADLMEASTPEGGPDAPQPTGGPGAPPPAAVIAIHDTAGTPFFTGTLHALAGRRSVRMLDDPEPDAVLDAVGTADGDDVLFACHGAFDPEQPAASALRLGAGAGLSLSALSGELALPRCRCVVLGACESGLARAEILSEYIGLAGVLMSAGIRNVVASLWEVSQLGTAILLADCLLALGDGGDVPAALADAQRSLRALTREQVGEWVAANLPALAPAIEPALAKMAPEPFGHAAEWAGFFASGPGPAPPA